MRHIGYFRRFARLELGDVGWWNGAPVAGRDVRRLGQPTMVFPSESGSPAAVELAASAADLRAFVPIVASVAGAFARPAAASLDWPCLVPVAGAPSAGSAGASAAPALDSHVAFPAVAGISCLASHSLCWQERDVRQAEGR